MLSYLMSGEFASGWFVGNDRNNIDIEFTERGTSEKVSRAVQLRRTRDHYPVSRSRSMQGVLPSASDTPCV